MGLTLQASRDNTSNVPASHGQDGWGQGPGVHGDKGYITSGRPREFGGYTDWYKAVTNTPPTYMENGKKYASYNPNARQPGRLGDQFTNRKGSSFDPLPIRWLDDPHGNTW